MNTYLLLRNNKESGPLTLEEVVKIGIKPYDLVWVHGRSAAWRYPSEIEELKKYAPVIEEQPYERFYKKSDEEETVGENPQIVPAKKLVEPELIVNKQSSQKINQPTPREPERPMEEKKVAVISKKVFVSLPGKPAESKPIAKPALKNLEPIPDYTQSTYETDTDYEKHFPTSSTRAGLPINNPVTTATTYSVTEDNTPIELEERYSQPLDEIKEMYVKTLVDRKRRRARKNFLKDNSLIAAIVIGVLAIGMLFGYLFTKPKKQMLATLPEQTISNPVNNEADARFAAEQRNTINTRDNGLASGEISEANNDFNDELVQKNKLKKVSPPRQYENNSSEEQNAAGAVTTDPLSGERKRAIRDENGNVKEDAKSATNKTAIENIWQDVSIKANNYKTGPFGGIRDLNIIISNKSSYTLDKVEVVFKYIGMEKQVVKTQTMVFNNIAPGSQFSSDVPRSGRGVTVDYSIKKINVRDFSFVKSSSR